MDVLLCPGMARVQKITVAVGIHLKVEHFLFKFTSTILFPVGSTLIILNIQINFLFKKNSDNRILTSRNGSLKRKLNRKLNGNSIQFN